MPCTTHRRPADTPERRARRKFGELTLKEQILYLRASEWDDERIGRYLGGYTVREVQEFARS